MAFQRDYVLRLIEMMGEFFRRLYQLSNEMDREKELDAACRDQCGLSLESVLVLSKDTLIELLPPRALLMASELMYIRASVVTVDEEKRSDHLFRSLQLLAALDEEETLCVERAMRLKELMDACAQRLSPEDYMACARFFLAGEKYDHCEDAIFLAIEEAREKAKLIIQGREMLNDMLLLPENALLSGGMTRQEVMEAIEDLEAWEKS